MRLCPCRMGRGPGGGGAGDMITQACRHVCTLCAHVVEDICHVAPKPMHQPMPMHQPAPAAQAVCLSRWHSLVQLGIRVLHASLQLLLDRLQYSAGCYYTAQCVLCVCTLRLHSTVATHGIIHPHTPDHRAACGTAGGAQRVHASGRQAVVRLCLSSVWASEPMVA